MWEYFDPNPVRSGAIDCAVRAISKALDVSWERAYVMLTLNGFLMGNIISADEVWGSLLRQNGFKRQIVPDSCPDCYKLEEFCDEHPHGTFVVKSDGHVATVQDGKLYDSWDSSQKVVIYFWYRPDEQEQKGK